MSDHDAQPEGLTHLRPDGAAHMVNVGAKSETERTATARATVITRDDVIALVVDGRLSKGEAIGTSRLAGIMGAKATSALIPLCHPLPITSVEVDVEPIGTGFEIRATVSTRGRTGVEMEALTAASIAALTLYDMIKGVDRAARITDVLLLEKLGGKSGHWVRQ